MHELGGLYCKTANALDNEQIRRTRRKIHIRLKLEQGKRWGGSPMGLARSEGEAGQLGWRGAEEVARLGLALRPTRLAKGAGEEAERGRRWRWARERGPK